MQNVRNFSIIAHIDHGKSTLADRFIQRCGGLPEREMGEQVLDSMDLERERGIAEIEDIIGIDASDAIRVSAKTGEGVDDVLEAVIARIPPPQGDPGAPLQALVIDSWFDNYVGVVMLVRLMQGTLRPKDRILLMATGAAYNCEQVGVFTPKAVARDRLEAGDVGFVVAGLKELKAA